MIELTEEQIKEKVDFIDYYLKANNAADASIVDANANVSSKNIATMSAELNKDMFIQINRGIIHKELQKTFGKEIADKYLKQLEEHIIYTHDETSLAPYCVAASMYPFLTDGLRSFGGESDPPKHLSSFNGGFINYAFALASQFAGAVATVEYLVYFDYFARKDFGVNYLTTHSREITQELQQTIYALNQPAAARNYQSVFWNISIFDKYYFEAIFEHFRFPDGSAPNWKTLKKLQKHFMKWFNKERTKSILTFPVVTASFLNNGVTFKDPEFGDMISQELAEGNSFFLFTSANAQALASCCRLQSDVSDSLNDFSYSLGAGGVMTGCYDEETEVLTSDGWKFFKDITLKDTLPTITSNGEIEYHAPNKLFKYEWNNNLKRIKTRDIDLLVTPNHNMAVINHHNNTISLDTVENIEQSERKRTYFPTVGKNTNTSDKYFVLPEISSEWVAGNHKSKRTKVWEKKYIPMKSFAKFMGLFLSEGCINKASKDYDIRLVQLKEENKQYFRDCLNELPFNWKEYTDKDGCSYFVIKNKQLFKYLEQFGNCYTKFIPSILLQQGIDVLTILYESLMLGDGHKKKTTNQEIYYTVSKGLVDTFTELCLKINRHPSVQIKKPRETFIKGRKVESSNLQYVINIGHKKMVSIDKKNSSINNEYYKGYVYCVEIPNHTLYVRRNGKYIWCGNSLNVITLNMNRFIQNYEKHLKEVEDSSISFKEYLRKQINYIHKYQVAFRRVFERYLKAGILPAYNIHAITIDKQYLTLGINGLVEGAEYLGFTINNNTQYKTFIRETLKVFNKENKRAKEKYGYKFNTEFVPAENLGVKFAKWDKQDGYKVPRDCYNSYFYLVEDNDISPIDKLTLHGKDTSEFLDGGSACHINLENYLTKESFNKLIHVAIQEGCPYFCFNIKVTICNQCNTIDKRTLLSCTKCGSTDVDHATRIIGYLKRVKDFSSARQEEEALRYYHRK